MVKRDELIHFIDSFFGHEFIATAKRTDDYVNGVQIKGASNVRNVALGVSVSLDFLKRCRDAGANFVIVHHGIGLNRLDHYLNNVLKERLRIIIDSEITLLGYHYMLDAHPEIGNNAQILSKLGADIVSPFHDGWGFVGELRKATPLDTVIRKLSLMMDSKPIVYRNGIKRVKRIAVVSGGAAPRMSQMGEYEEKAVDLYVTGETKEGVPDLVKEAKINYAAFGHYNSEKYGVCALGNLIQKKFPTLDVKFIDIPCNL
jgi:dinuclear metal center YbgI/SA1388 family protein